MNAFLLNRGLLELLITPFVGSQHLGCFLDVNFPLEKTNKEEKKKRVISYAAPILFNIQNFFTINLFCKY